MPYRTKTYIAGDWTGDKDLIDKLHEWNESSYFKLHFSDVHKYIQARDSSLYCSIKRSLSDRMNLSKTFIFIVGKQTDNLTKGSCQYCKHYLNFQGTHICFKNNHSDTRSFIEFEYQKAIKDNLRIIVLYNYSTIYKDKCPDLLKNIGTHIPAYYFGANGGKIWNYTKIRNAINNVA